MVSTGGRVPLKKKLIIEENPVENELIFFSCSYPKYEYQFYRASSRVISWKVVSKAFTGKQYPIADSKIYYFWKIRAQTQSTSKNHLAVNFTQ